MPFNESIKRKVKERAHYRCCLCRKYWVAHVHHIKPEAESGPNTEENAAPLCANCHDLYGGNPDKRKFIKDNRDFWYDLCDKASTPDFRMICEIHEHVHKEVVTRQDLDNALRPLYNILDKKLEPAEQRQQISDLTAAISNAVVGSSFYVCPRCQQTCGISNIACPNCGEVVDFGQL